MGTSGSYGGAGNGSPLIPGFLNDPTPASAPVIPSAPLPNAPLTSSPPTPLTPPGAPQPRPAPTQTPMPARFSAPRGNFSRFARSGGADRAALGRALSGYVSSAAGGSRQAARRMGASRGAGARLLSFLSDAQSRGPVEALRSLNLQALAGRPIEEVFLGIAEYVCPLEGRSMKASPAMPSSRQSLISRIKVLVILPNLPLTRCRRYLRCSLHMPSKHVSATTLGKTASNYR